MKWKNTFLVGRLQMRDDLYSKSQGLHAKWSPKLPGPREFSRGDDRADGPNSLKTR
jgi:hypothetical protein